MNKYKYFHLGGGILMSALMMNVSAEGLTKESQSPNSHGQIKINYILKGIPLIEGRLSFSSEKELSEKIDLLRKITDESVSKELYPFYEAGFSPLVPFYRETDEVRQQVYFEKKLDKIDSDLLAINKDELIASTIELDDTDDVISDDIFASLLNDAYELEVDGEVYKYTKEGVYKVAKKSVNTLYKHLQEKLPPTTAKLLSTCENHFATQDYENTYSGYNSYEISDGLVYFEECGGSGSSSGSGSGSGSGTGNTSPATPAWQVYLNNLEYCRNGNGDIFGHNNVCISKFNSSYRIKSKYWHENYLFFRSAGLKIKHQKKGWLGWHSKKTDELRLGFDKAYMEYHFDDLDYIFPYNNSEILDRAYTHDGKIYDQNGNQIGNEGHEGVFNVDNFNTVQVWVKLPSFCPDESVESESLIPESMISEVWEVAENIASNNGQTNLQSIAITGVTPTEQISDLGIGRWGRKVAVYFVDRDYHRFNVKKIKKTFDMHHNLIVGFNAQGVASNVERDPFQIANAQIDTFGLGRRGSIWRGSKLRSSIYRAQGSSELSCPLTD